MMSEVSERPARPVEREKIICFNRFGLYFDSDLPFLDLRGASEDGDPNRIETDKQS